MFAILKITAGIAILAAMFVIIGAGLGYLCKLLGDE